MALIKCKECGHKMSDSAKACPNCGSINKESQEYKNKRIIEIIIGSILLVVSLFFYIKSMS